jgi:hypothetical protein
MSLVRSCCYLGMYPKHGDVSGDGIDSLLELEVESPTGMRCVASQPYAARNWSYLYP